MPTTPNALGLQKSFDTEDSPVELGVLENADGQPIFYKILMSSGRDPGSESDAELLSIQKSMREAGMAVVLLLVEDSGEQLQLFFRVDLGGQVVRCRYKVYSVFE